MRYHTEGRVRAGRPLRAGLVWVSSGSLPREKLAAAESIGVKCNSEINRENRAMGKSTKRPVGTRYGAAYGVKIAFDSLGLSFVLPYAVAVLLRLGCIAAGVMSPVKGIHGAVIAMVILALVLALYCYALPNHPERFSGLPRGAFYGENMRLFVPILEGYCGILIHMVCLELALMAVFFLWWPVGIISDWFWISSISVLAISMIPYLLMPHLLDREIRRREGGAREAFVAGELELLQEARRGVACWRLGWRGWAAEVLIYAGLSWGLWRAMRGGAVAWEQWWIASAAGLAVAGLRVAERFAPRWRPAGGSAEVWAWGVRALRLAVAAAACLR